LHSHVVRADFLRFELLTHPPTPPFMSALCFVAWSQSLPYPVYPCPGSPFKYLAPLSLRLCVNWLSDNGSVQIPTLPFCQHAVFVPQGTRVPARPPLFPAQTYHPTLVCAVFDLTETTQPFAPVARKSFARTPVSVGSYTWCPRREPPTFSCHVSGFPSSHVPFYFLFLLFFYVESSSVLRATQGHLITSSVDSAP